MAVMRFTTTRLSGLQAAGRTQELQHSVIAPYLERELGPAFGRLFADFEVEKGSDVRAWYTDAKAPPRLVLSLTAAEQLAIHRRLAEMIVQVLDFAGRIAAESTQKANLARILTAATTFPAEDVWADGDQPIVVNWGFHHTTVQPGAPRQIMVLIPDPNKPVVTARPSSKPARPSTVEKPAVVAPLVAPIVTPRREIDLARFLAPTLWTLFVLLVAASYWRLLPACGLTRHVPILWSLSAFNACSSTTTRLAEEGAELQRLVEQEELRVAQHQRQCAVERPPEPARPPIVPPAGTPPPRPPTPAETDDHIHRVTPDAPQGDVEVSLEWNNKADLDLIVECPGGEKLWHGSPDLQACGGRLQKDINRSGGPLLDNPLEQAAWPSSPHGTFKIEVQLYGYNSVPADTEIPYTIRIKRGSDVQVIKGRIKGASTIVTVTTASL